MKNYPLRGVDYIELYVFNTFQAAVKLLQRLQEENTSSSEMNYQRKYL
jgi:hypothetical protein